MRTRRFRHRLLTTGSAMMLAFALTACEGIPKMPEVQEPPRGEAADPERPRAAFERMQKDAVTVLEADIDDLLPSLIDGGDRIPNREVGPIFVEEMPALELLRILVRPHDLAVVPAPGLKDVTITLLDPKKRPMGEAVRMVADQADLFYTYEDGVLRIDDKRDFSVTLPTMSDVPEPNTVSGGSSGGGGGGQAEKVIDTFQATFEALGAENVNVDKNAGILSFEANHRAYTRISEYTRKVAEEKSVLVYDTWIYSVQLQDEVGLGIDFTELEGKIGDTGVELDNAESVIGNVGDSGLGTNLGLGGVALSLSDLSIGSFAVDAILSFLDNQGDVRALSKPSLTMSSGRSADIFVGSKQNYIRKVTVETESSDTDDDGDDDEGSAQITPQIDELNLGVGMGLAGNYTNGVITSDLKLRISSLVNMEERNFRNDDQEVSLQLPETSERNLNTRITSRPGDIIVLGGLIQDNGSLTGQDFMTLPTSRKESQLREELVIIMRPRLIQIRPSGHPDLVAYQKKKAAEIAREATTHDGPANAQPNAQPHAHDETGEASQRSHTPKRSRDDADTPPTPDRKPRAPAAGAGIDPVSDVMHAPTLRPSPLPDVIAGAAPATGTINASAGE